jgi:hypothetical protein
MTQTEIRIVTVARPQYAFDLPQKAESQDASQATTVQRQNAFRTLRLKMLVARQNPVAHEASPL